MHTPEPVRHANAKKVSSRSLPGKLLRSFLSVKIARKMLLGYLTLVALISLISAFTMYNLERLNAINEVIVRTDVPLAEIADRMIDTLISQEFYARRYAILRSSEMLVLAREKGKEFDTLVEKARSLPRSKDIPVDRFAALHARYTKLLMEEIRYSGDPSSPAAQEQDSAIRKGQEELIGLIKDSSSRARKDQNEKAVMISDIGAVGVRITALLCFAGILLSVISTVLVTGSIAGRISRLKLATQKISEGKFDLIQDVVSHDELGELANAFNEMTKRLKHLEGIHLDANPLTRLPGNIAIENILTKRLEANSPLAFCYIDLDDFKAFNDRYGYARGSDVIMAVGKIVEKCAFETGAPDDFVGHIGGDDFVVITTPDRFKKTCNRIIEAFASAIPKFYDQSDLNRGYIMGKTRQGQAMKFPIMSLSIAVVTNLERRLISPMRVGEIAAELKEYAKSIPGSVYVVDRPRKEPGEEGDETALQIMPKTSAKKGSCSP